MNDKFLRKLQNDFILVRHLHTKDCFDHERFYRVLYDIREARDKLSQAGNALEVQFLLYCTDTLLEIIDERNTDKIYDFADVVHNAPEVCMSRRNIYSLGLEMANFRKKYGKKYFADFLTLKPKFSKKAPLNSKDFFSPYSDFGFKVLHPLAYKLLCFVGILVLILPAVVFVIYAVVCVENLGWTALLGFAGSFIFGVVLFNIVAAWLHQYLGHKVTALCLVFGALLTSLFFVL